MRLLLAMMLLGAPASAAAAAPALAPALAPAPAPARAPALAADVAPVTYPVFATREGLVGETTANGHVIVERDHFVALPSRRGLSSKGGGEYTVRVCSAATKRCAYAPVWDVGPWNTRDDYWNATRDDWTDLPRGKPEAQAAFQDGYNGGKDQFGRRVLNPAGIDLADGTFWDALLLRDNAWVSVTYLWTGPATLTGRIDTGGAPLRLRAAPNTSAAIVGLAGEFSRVPIECQVVGERVGSSDLWDRVAPGTYVSHEYVVTDVVIPRCAQA